MFRVGLGALLVLGGVLYMARAAIWRGPLSGADSPRPVRDTLEPPRRGVRFLGLGTNWPGILLMAIGAILLAFFGPFRRWRSHTERQVGTPSPFPPFGFPAIPVPL